MKTILGLLLTDRAVAGDVYRAYGTDWRVTDAGALRSGKSYMCMDTLSLLSSEGWVRISREIPLPPTRFEFETEVWHYRLNPNHGGDFFVVADPGLKVLHGKGRRVKVTVEELP